jgi:hypothetical protein
VHSQFFPQQHVAAGAVSALMANAGIVSKTAAVAMAKPLIIFEKVHIVLSSLRIDAALGFKIGKLKILIDSREASEENPH